MSSIITFFYSITGIIMFTTCSIQAFRFVRAKKGEQVRCIETMVMWLCVTFIGLMYALTQTHDFYMQMTNILNFVGNVILTATALYCRYYWMWTPYQEQKKVEEKTSEQKIAMPQTASVQI